MATSPEQLLISSIINDSDVHLAFTAHITDDMFRAYDTEWEWLSDYYRKYKATPSREAFRLSFPSFKIKDVHDTRYYADEVRKGHAKRLLTKSMSETADYIAQGKIDDAVQLMGSSVVKVAGAIGSSNNGDIVTMFDDVLQDVEQRVQRVRDTGYSGIPTGFPTLDKRTGGPQPGDLWIVGARLGEGKSFTMQAMATAALLNGYVVQFDALEQSRAQVAMRIHTMLSTQVGRELYRTTDLMQGRNFNLVKYKKFVRGLRKQLDGKLHVNDSTRGRIGIMGIAAQIEQTQPDIVFVDYLTLLDKKGNEHQDIAAVASGLLGVAQEYKIPVIAANQLNRQHGLGRDNAGPEALSGSDAIGQDATAVITIKQTSSLTLQMKMAKFRNGPAGYKWYSHFDPDHGIFKEVDYQEMLDLKDRAKALDNDDED